MYESQNYITKKLTPEPCGNHLKKYLFHTAHLAHTHFRRPPTRSRYGQRGVNESSEKWPTTLHPTRSTHNKPRCLVRHAIVARASSFFALQTSPRGNSLPWQLAPPLRPLTCEKHQSGREEKARSSSVQPSTILQPRNALRQTINATPRPK